MNKIDAETFLTTLYNIFLNRMPDKSGLEYYIKSITGQGLPWDNVVENLLISPEREKLINCDPYYLWQHPCLSEQAVEAFCAEHGITRTLSCIREELRLLEGEVAAAIELFKVTDEYGYYSQCVRMLRFAAIQNYRNYTWILGRIYKYYRKFDMVAELGGRWRHYDPYFASTESNPQEVPRQSQFNNQRLADELLNRFLEANPEMPEQKMRRVLDTSNRMRMMDAQAQEKCNEICAAIYYGEEAKPEPYQDERTLIFVGGFQFSGSSAIADWLVGSRHCIESLPPDKFPFSETKELTAFLLDLKPVFSSLEKQESDYRIKLVFFFLKTILNYYKVDSLMNFSAKLFHGIHPYFCWSEGLFMNFLTASEKFFHEINYFIQHKCDICVLKAIFTNFLFNILTLINPESGKFIVLDNAVPVFRNSVLLEMFCGKHIYISVLRDPRDNYVSSKTYLNTDLRYFIRSYGCRYAYLNNFNGSLKEFYSHIPVSYERFVQEPAYRNKLSQRLGLEADISSPRFNPEYSRTRIGKYINFEDQAAIKRIADAFPDKITNEYLKTLAGNIEN